MGTVLMPMLTCRTFGGDHCCSSPLSRFHFVKLSRFGIVVYRLFDGKAWRITDHLFYPDPLAARYKLHHLEFYWMDGIFGMALSPAGYSYEDRMLYFHSMSGYREFYVKTSYLREEKPKSDGNAFKVLGQSRGEFRAKWV